MSTYCLHNKSYQQNCETCGRYYKPEYFAMALACGHIVFAPYRKRKSARCPHHRRNELVMARQAKDEDD